jgi:hypothetical protein
MRRLLLYSMKLSLYETCSLEGAAASIRAVEIGELAFKSRPAKYLVQCRARHDERVQTR